MRTSFHVLFTKYFIRYMVAFPDTFTILPLGADIHDNRFRDSIDLNQSVELKGFCSPQQLFELFYGILRRSQILSAFGYPNIIEDISSLLPVDCTFNISSINVKLFGGIGLPQYLCMHSKDRFYYYFQM